MFECAGGGGGGYGDPLERAPERVADDVGRGLVSRGAARSRYGVVIDDDEPASYDLSATTSERSAIHAARRKQARSPSRLPLPDDGVDGARLTGVNEYLGIVAGPQGPVVRCRCGCVLCAASEDYRDSLAVREAVGRSDTGAPDESPDLPSFVIREFFCPDCWTLVDTNVSMVETEV